ncbi:MAG TPA: FhaA domain-containing protein [Candidatus Tyrphobacter sp.]
MSWLGRFEKACAAFIERAFARSFPSDLAPAHVARKLVAVMETQTRRESGHLLAPGSYLVYVHPEEFERLAVERAYLEREWSELLRDLAARVGAFFEGGEPVVTMLANESVPPGAAEIEVSRERRSPPVQPRRERRYQLRMLKGVPAGGLYRVEGEVSIGRGEDVSVMLTDPSVSRRHASIAVVDGVPVVRDLGSTNGTFVNGERVQTHTLSAGDRLTFGNTEMRFEGAA